MAIECYESTCKHHCGVEPFCYHPHCIHTPMQYLMTNTIMDSFAIEFVKRIDGQFTCELKSYKTDVRYCALGDNPVEALINVLELESL